MPRLPCRIISMKLLASVLHGGVSLGRRNNKLRRNREELADLGRKLQTEEVVLLVSVVVSVGVPGKPEGGLVVGLWLGLGEQAGLRLRGMAKEIERGSS